MRIVHDAAAVEDIVQRVFIKLCRLCLENGQPNAQLRAWLFAVTHNDAVDHIRRESRERLARVQALES